MIGVVRSNSKPIEENHYTTIHFACSKSKNYQNYLFYIINVYPSVQNSMTILLACLNKWKYNVFGIGYLV